MKLSRSVAAGFMFDRLLTNGSSQTCTFLVRRSHLGRKTYHAITARGRRDEFRTLTLKQPPSAAPERATGPSPLRHLLLSPSSPAVRRRSAALVRELAAAT